LFAGFCKITQQVKLNCCCNAETGFLFLSDGDPVEKKRFSGNKVNQCASFEPIFDPWLSFFKNY
jgi:hypothetical protein